MQIGRDGQPLPETAQAPSTLAQIGETAALVGMLDTFRRALDYADADGRREFAHNLLYAIAANPEKFRFDPYWLLDAIIKQHPEFIRDVVTEYRSEIAPLLVARMVKALKNDFEGRDLVREAMAVAAQRELVEASRSETVQALGEIGEK